METTPRWLADDEQALWRDWLAVQTMLPAHLNRMLQADGLSLPDFDVLVLLSETPGGRLRIGEVATALTWERSRTSHHLRRMEGRGLVAREECADDGRGAFVVLTHQGRTAIEQAAPGHVEVVREALFDRVADDDRAALARVLRAVRAGLERD